MLHERAQGVTVRCHQNGLACCQVGLDVRLPVREHTAENVLEALGAGCVLNVWRSEGRVPASRGRCRPAAGGGTS